MFNSYLSYNISSVHATLKSTNATLINNETTFISLSNELKIIRPYAFYGNSYLEMVVIPLIFSAIIIGISSVGDNKQLGRFGGKMVFYYAIITIIAVVLGAFLAIGLKPGDGVQSYISTQSQIEIQQAVQQEIDKQNQGSIVSNIVSIIPSNPITSLANNDIVPIIIFVLIFATRTTKFLP